MKQSPWWVHTVVLVSAVVSFMAISAWDASPWWEYAFFSDDSPVAWLSSVLLAANAAVALRLVVEGAMTRTLGVALAASMAVLALDEQFLLHEQVQQRYAGPILNWPTWAFLVAGAIAGYGIYRSVLTPASRGLLVTAVVVALFALSLDLIRPPAMLATLEEGVEVLAETIFLSGLLAVPARYVQSAS